MSAVALISFSGFPMRNERTRDRLFARLRPSQLTVSIRLAPQVSLNYLMLYGGDAGFTTFPPPRFYGNLGCLSETLVSCFGFLSYFLPSIRTDIVLMSVTERDLVNHAE